MATPTGTEVELKRRVRDLAALMRICTAANGLPAFTAMQRNQFLDTPGAALDAGRFVLRIREETSPSQTTVYLTAKGPALKSADLTLSHVPEEEIVVDAQDVTGLHASPMSALALLESHSSSTPARRALVAAMRAAIGTEPLRLAGEFVTERTRVDVAFPEGFVGVLELDRVRFPGDQIHHEVEFEVPADVDVDVAKAAFEALFQRADVEGFAAPGKAKRFFAALRGETLA
jgi:uncharacterized protein YjbK